MSETHYISGVNMNRLRDCLTFLGCASDTDEIMAALLPEFVNRLTRSVMQAQGLLRTALPKKPLTSQQLDVLIQAHVGGAELLDGEYRAMVVFAAALERAHGIGPCASPKKNAD